jgi:hypothetical protein
VGSKLNTFKKKNYVIRTRLGFMRFLQIRTIPHGQGFIRFHEQIFCTIDIVIPICRRRYYYIFRDENIPSGLVLHAILSAAGCVWMPSDIIP